MAPGNVPPGRVARQRPENDENSTTGRMTRAKAAAQSGDDMAMPAKSGALQAKRSSANLANTTTQRTRSALGDVSNVGRVQVTEGKKPASSKIGLASKGSQPTGVQKTTSTRAPARSALGTIKETGKRTELRKPAAGSTASSGKRKVSSSIASSARDDTSAEDAEPLRKRAHLQTADDTETDVKGEFFRQDARRAAAKEAKQAMTGLPPRPANVDDPDLEDIEDPLMVAEYTTEIFNYLRELETKSLPNHNYMSHQDDLEWKTRGILVDWLVEVHTRFHLLPETLFLAVNIIDRFLSEKVVQLDRLQLVGITAMFIASKYEEVLSPHVENFKRIADDGFSEAEILSAERFVLSVLNYDLSYPNPMNFLRRISKADNYDILSRTMGKYFLEVSLLDHRLMAFRPSHMAAGAMYLSRLMLDRGEWDPTLAYFSGYTEEDVEPVVQILVDYLARPLIHEAFFKKYASKKFMKVSILSRQWAKKHAATLGITDISLALDQITS